MLRAISTRRASSTRKGSPMLLLMGHALRAAASLPRSVAGLGDRTAT